MIFAIKKGDFIENMIVAHADQIEELQQALQAEIIDPSEYGLTIGDYWNGQNWTRNVNGEQVVLEPVEPQPTTEERVTELEDTTSALEDAICEMDAANEERMAAIEDALCEMDMG